MKKLIFTILMFLTFSLCAQDMAVKFMGIPVDGKKSSMIAKLKKKGFKYDRNNDCLTGRFNGNSVKLFIVENNKKVYRICVMDAYYSNETDIVIKYNNLIDQFENNKNYKALGDNEKIKYEENLHTDMLYNNKRYEAIFCQKRESVIDYSDLNQNLSELSYIDVYNNNKEFIDSFHEHCDSLAKDFGEEYYKNYYYDSIIGKNNEEVFEYDKSWYKIYVYSLGLIIDMKRTVWFMIREDDDNYRQYKILMFYDNGFNAPNGEDL